MQEALVLWLEQLLALRPLEPPPALLRHRLGAITYSLAAFWHRWACLQRADTRLVSNSGNRRPVLFVAAGLSGLYDQ